MSTTTSKLVESIDKGDALGIEKFFKESLATKLAGRIREAREVTAKTMFSEEAANDDEEPSPVTEEVETLDEGGSKEFLAAKAKLNAIGMHIHKTGYDNEVRVVHKEAKHNPDLGYFTHDLDDAVSSGEAIVKRMGGLKGDERQKYLGLKEDKSYSTPGCKGCENDTYNGVCMECTKARAKAAGGGGCKCGNKKVPTDVKKSGSRSWISCHRCLGQIKQLS